MQEQGGVQSFIRAIDRISVGAIGVDPPREMPAQQLDYWLCIGLKSGEALGRHQVKLRAEKPSGERLPTIEIDVQLEGSERGVNINIPLNSVQFDTEGLWWFDVLFGENDVVLTRVPLRLTYQPQRVATGHSE